MSIINDFAKKCRFRIIEYNDNHSRFIVFHQTWDIIERDYLIIKVKTHSAATRYIIEGENIEL